MGLEDKRQIIEFDKKLGNRKEEMRIRILKETIADLEKIEEPDDLQKSELKRLKKQLADLESKL